MSRKIDTPLNPQTFQDGLASFWHCENIATAGNRPSYQTKKLFDLPYEVKKVGDVRYYAALQADSKISKVIRVPKVHGIQPSGDVVTLSGNERQYKIQKVSENTLTNPESMDVTLEISKTTYRLLTEEETS